MLLFSDLAELKNRLELTALARGMDATHSIVVTVNNVDTNNQATRFVVGHTEPTSLDIPLNVLWYVRDPASSFYDMIVRRSSRSPTSPYEGTWVQEIDLNLILTTTQIWDQPKPTYQDLYDHSSQLGNAHNLEADDIGAVDEQGDTMQGPLYIRTLGDGEEYGSDEAVPRSWLELMLDQMRSVTENIIQSFANINSQIDNLRTRVEILELSLLGLKGHIYEALTAAATWNIQHDMNNTNVVIQVYEGSNVVLPASITVVDANNVQIVFATPVAGQAQILPVIEFA